jgi:hypothetical protein
MEENGVFLDMYCLIPNRRNVNPTLVAVLTAKLRCRPEGLVGISRENEREWRVQEDRA